MAKVDVRKLKDSATEAFSKQKWRKAAELYQQVSRVEPNDPDWSQREGECWRQLGNVAQATVALGCAAEGYARLGFLPKAIAVCRNLLQLDPRHTRTQALLAELYAKRDGNSGSAPAATAARAAPSAAPGTVRSATPLAAPSAVASPWAAPSAGLPVAAVPPPSRPAGTPRFGDPIELVPEDEPAAHPQPAPAALAIESLHLHEVLGGRQSQQFAAVTIEPSTDEDAAPHVSAYEIELGEDDFEPIEVEVPAPRPAPRVVELSLPGPDSELDFSELLADDAQPEAEVAVAIEFVPTDENDWSDVAPEPAAPAFERRLLPRIPLFSCLSADRLRQLIETCEVRDVAAGEFIVREGAPGASLFVIASGRARVVVAASPEPLAELEEGDFFGELGLITDFPRSASVVATIPMQLLEVSRAAIGRLVGEDPEVLRVLMSFFRDRMVARWLKTSSLFSMLSPDDAHHLASRWTFVELLPGVRAVTEGRRADGMFLLLCGQARVVTEGRVIATLHPGELFGEMSLLTHQPAVANVETETKCWALCLERRSFQEIMVTYPQILQYVSELADSRRSAIVRLD